MATKLRSDPALRAAIEAARELAAAGGELRVRPWSVRPSALPPEAVEIIASWVREGGYSQAVADIATSDADLADQ